MPEGIYIAMKPINNEQRHIATKEIAWARREDMVYQGLVTSIPWMALVNLCFALMVYFRNALFDQIDAQYSVAPSLAKTMDIAMLGICLLSLSITVAAWRKLRWLSGLLILLSLLWSVSCFYFIVHWRLPFSWPLTTILMLTALTALYFYPLGLLAYLLPLWAMLPLASYFRNQGINIHFAVVWVIFTLILICGYCVLRRWFDEAWRRNQQNKMLIARLDALAHQDALTGTANRRALENLLAQASGQNKAFALMMLDVDYFKRYNDRYGHQAGDECLARVAQVLKNAVRSPDDMVARYGGEEFAIVLFGATDKACEEVAWRIQQALIQAAIPHEDSSVSKFVTVSIGIAAKGVVQNAQNMLLKADEALYRAKEKGRNGWSR